MRPLWPHDCRRTHGSQSGASAEVRKLGRHRGRSLARGRVQRGCVCENAGRKVNGDAVLAGRKREERVCWPWRASRCGACGNEQESVSTEASASEALSRESGVFVTLQKRGELRGCVGYTSAMKPLYLTVRDTATLAALRDTRFQPVSAAELPELEYEISVLSPLRRVTDVNQIKVGEHGLLMKNGEHEGLLLPQVPVEQQWDRQTFLEETCRKAGMNAECWKSDDTDIFLFTAVVLVNTSRRGRSMLAGRRAETCARKRNPTEVRLCPPGTHAKSRCCYRGLHVQSGRVLRNKSLKGSTFRRATSVPRRSLNSENTAAQQQPN